MTCHFALYDRSLSVTITRGTWPCFLRSLRIKRVAALAFLRLCTRTSMTINSPPGPAFFASNCNNNLVEVPLVTKSADRPSPDLVGEASSEFLCPCSYRLMAHKDAPGGKHILDHAQAQWKAEVEPDCMCSNLGGKAMATLQRMTAEAFHAASSDISISFQLTLRCPSS
jgi:hypothetical protein